MKKKEINYIITAEQYSCLLKEFSKRAIRKDKGGICARIYYDTDEHELLKHEKKDPGHTKLVYEQENAPLPKEAKEKLVPTMYLAWDEISFHAKGKEDLVVTIKQNLRHRFEDFDFNMGSAGKLMLSNGQVLMTVSKKGFTPFWLASLFKAKKIKPWQKSEYVMGYEKKAS
ncbi:MAG: hypothetical protein K6G01_09015 [Eubacterium sp.]|nr:hypothetical protein [Eubacterium sp.]